MHYILTKKRIYQLIISFFALFIIQNLNAQAPTLGTYPNSSVIAGRNTTVTPSAAPANTVTTVAYSNANFKGILAVDPSSGVVRVTDALLAGIYPITVEATGIGSTTTTFTLTVTNPNCSQGILNGTTNIPVSAGPYDVAVGDFNNDGNQDFATANNNANSISIRLGNGAAGFSGTTDLTGVGSNPRYLAAGDFNGDGNQDIVNSAVSSAAVFISLGDGLGGFAPATSVAVASFPTGVTVGDFNNDGNLDFVAGTSGSTVSVRLGNGFGGFTVMPNVVTTSPNWTIGVGDFNEDGKQDLAIISNNAVAIRVGDGAGNFSGTTDIAVGAGCETITVTDFNHDNHQDFATANNSAGTVSVRLGDGLGGFSGTTELTIGSNPIGIASGDFNGDGNVDLAIAQYGSVILIRYGDGLGNFNGTFSISGGGYATQRIVVGDFNNDGFNDVAAPNGSSNNVAIRIGGSNEINVKGNNTSIVDGDVTPSLTDFTDFGAACSGTVVRTFTIENTGTQTLSITGVTITGAQAADFSVISAPASSVAVAGSTTFQVRFTPGATGVRNATITIANNDCDETSYDFAISGTGTTPVTGTTVVTNVSCFGGSNGAINLTPNGGTAPYTFNWLPSGPTTEDRTGLVAGTYSVQITDVNGCTGTVAATLTQPTSPVSGTTVVTNVSCFGGSNGTINLTPTGGSGGYTFNWLPSGPTTEDRTGLVAGTYSVQIIDVNGCTGTVTATVTQPTTPVSGTTVVTNVACFGGSNGAINLTPSGGSGGYTFNWLPSGPTTEDRTGLVAGTYSVQITDVNGCTSTVTATVTQPTSPVSGTTIVTNVACFGGSNGVIDLTPSGGNPGYTYNWGSSITTQDRIGISAGTYSVIITDANGCTGTVSATVTQPPAISVTAASQTNIACFGGNTGAAAINAATGGAGSFTYNWSPGNPTGDGTTSVTGLTAGTWTVTTTDANGCTATQAFNVTQPPAISVTAASQTNVSCFGGSNGAAAINAATGGAGSFTYDWTPGNPTGDGTTSVTGLTAGTWTVTTTDANGCTATQAFNVTQPPAISVTAASQTNVSCFGGSNGAAAINAATGGAGSFTYDWTPGNPTGDGTISVNGLTAGTWTVTTTDANGCTATNSFNVTQPPAISVTAASQTNVSCFGGSNGAAAINAATGGAGSFTYDWTPGNPTGDGTTSVTGLTAGTWTVTTTDANGCTATQAFNVTQPPAISVTAASQTNVSCFGGSNGATAINAATGGAGSFTYDWTPGNPTGDGTTSVTGLTVGTWTVTTTDANGCTATNSFTVTQPPAISVTASSQTNISCFGGSNGAASINTPTGGAGFFTYNWTPGNPIGEGTTSANGLSAGTWTVTATDINGCTATQSFNLTQPPVLTGSFTVVNPVLCNGGNALVTITASGGVSPYSGTGNTSVTAGSYSYQVTDDNGCTAISAFSITEPTAITFTSSQTNVSCNNGNNGTASVTASGGTGALSYAWSSGGTVSTETGLSAGSYFVTITDANSCSTTATFNITEPLTAITYFPAQTDVSCNGGSNGIATVVASGGTGTLTYAWTSGGTTDTETGLSIGNYSVTIMDANSCTTTATFTITEPTAITFTSSQTGVLCNGGNNGSAMVVATGGTGSFTYAWSSGGTSDMETGLSAGNYSVIITDANSCSTTATFTITEPTAITFTSSQTDVLCNGGNNGSAMVVATGGTGSFTYAWTSGGTSDTETGLPQGNYSVIITDANSCSTTATFTIAEPTVLAASVINATNPTTCSGTNGAIDIDVTGGTASYTFLWNNSDVNEDLTGVGAGSYSVIITDANGCTTTTNATINDPVAPIVTVSLPMDTVCGDQPVTITLSGESPMGGTWSGNNVSGNTFDAFAAGVGTHFITYTFTDVNSCTGNAIDSIYVDLCMGVEAIAATEWNLFPNPTNGAINIITTAELNSDVIVEIYSADGKLIASENEQQAKTITLDMTGKPVGVYFIRITANGMASMHRVVKI